MAEPPDLEPPETHGPPEPPEPPEPSVADLAETLRQAARAHPERIALGEIMDALGQRTYGPLLLVPGLIALLPTGAIPTVPSIMGTIMIIVGAQILLARDHIWLPDRLMRIRFPSHRVSKAADMVEPWLARLALALKPRLHGLTQMPLVAFAGATAIIMGAIMPPLELVPFASAAPSSVVVILGLGLTVGDGLWVFAGLTLGTAAIALAAWVIWSLV